MQIDYKKVGKLDDVLQVVSNIVEVRKASLVYNQKIYLEGEDKRLLCEADAVIACIDLSGKPSSLPDFIKREILK